MSSSRITVSLPEEVVQALREHTDNLSGYVSDAIARKLRQEAVQQFVDNYQSLNGTFSEAELQAADARMVSWTPDSRLIA